MSGAEKLATATTLATPFAQADYRRLPEGFPAELLEGQLVKQPTRTPYHQRLVLRFATRLVAAVGDRRVLVSPVDVWIDDRNVLQPDVLVLDEACDREMLEVPVPLLVIEVLSPSTARRDRDVKTDIYLRAGVREVWLVDPDSRSIEVRTDAGRRVVPPTGGIATPLVPGLEIVVEELFA